MSLLTREAILAAATARAAVEVDIPAWGGAVKIRELTVAELEQFSGRQVEDLDTALLLIQLSVVDDAGAPLLTVEDLRGLAAKSGGAGVRVLGAKIAEINGVKAAASDDLAKN